MLILRKNGIITNDINISGSIFIANNGQMIFGKKITIQSGPNKNILGEGFVTRLITRKDGYLKIGDYVGISNSTIISTKSIVIGNNVLIGNNTKIWDTDFHSIDHTIRNKQDNRVRTKPIEIKDNVFIGANTIILKGVTIGRKSIIGAGSVVCNNIPEGEIWAGNPARFVRSVETYV